MTKVLFFYLQFLLLEQRSEQSLSPTPYITYLKPYSNPIYRVYNMVLTDKVICG
jgi:hypothetical protein